MDASKKKNLTLRRDTRMKEWVWCWRENEINVKNENKFSGITIKSRGSKLNDTFAELWFLRIFSFGDYYSTCLSGLGRDYTHKKTYLNTNTHAPKWAKGITENLLTLQFPVETFEVTQLRPIGKSHLLLSA